MDQGALLGHIRSLEVEVQNQLQSCAWFKKNSEQLSRDIKEARASCRAHEQSQYALKQELADLKSPMAATNRTAPMPGSY